MKINFREKHNVTNFDARYLPPTEIVDRKNEKTPSSVELTKIISVLNVD